MRFSQPSKHTQRHPATDSLLPVLPARFDEVTLLVVVLVRRLENLRQHVDGSVESDSVDGLGFDAIDLQGGPRGACVEPNQNRHRL
jgi:hypothetical protein